ncbi:MAG: alpha-ketoacid dehydrogenase subunit beta [Eubacteriales bacterium]|nr:alpha-ketoacid dehydrogenase subunit beta [Eubacteriales bacterium]
MERILSYAQALREAMCERMRRDERVFLMGEDVGIYGGTFGVPEGMLEEFGPERVRDTPISENAFMGAGVGAALTGMRPIIDIMFSDFVSVCFDQIVNQAAKMRFMLGENASVPMVIRLAAGAGTGASAQHSQSLEGLFCHIPGLKVVVPSTPYDAKGLLTAAMLDDNPVLVFEQKKLYETTGHVPAGEYIVPLGAADVKREGSDLSIITYGRTVGMSLNVASRLQKDGIEAEVLDLRTLSPLDVNAVLKTAKKTGRVLIVHEAVCFAGFGAEIAAAIAGSDALSSLKKPIRRLGAAFSPIPSAREIETALLPNEESIYAAAKELTA